MTGQNDCQFLPRLPKTCFRGGVNPRGLKSLQLWQPDTTHYQSFEQLKYLHVSIGTFSGAIFVSAHSGEKTNDAIKHFYKHLHHWASPK